MGPLVLRLNVGTADLYEGYRAEVVTAAGEIVWRQESLTPQKGGSFVVLIDPEKLTSGAHRLTLIGRTPELETALAVYSFEMSHSQAP